ncbi:hypothetical protein [Capnocytophaga canimorsus]|uniref:hypothetical protein n=1 Tax=Capnocytophaga canimorsus TaxID=28188 RepID=UPI001BB41DF7|nr:hypothetical protein [Capnocytophaga canimorsus]
MQDLEGNHNALSLLRIAVLVGTALILEGNNNQTCFLLVSKKVGTALILEGNHNVCF